MNSHCTLYPRLCFGRLRGRLIVLLFAVEGAFDGALSPLSMDSEEVEVAAFDVVVAAAWRSNEREPKGPAFMRLAIQELTGWRKNKAEHPAKSLNLVRKYIFFLLYFSSSAHCVSGL
mmetsp:Transcript_22055/g.45970  ORF Transcript_22055/g.45970 Transcript_22055/m.45970 type:complete len:117 (+) Transcript_22055:844-1194(+)